MPARTNENQVDCSPAKRFFVEMLTRDIALEDAILDLLDNCVDGAMREQKKRKAKRFDGFKADITFDKKSFIISDNCGGIPLDVARNYAFRMGKPKSADNEGNLPTVGAYGIGMKRALFRLGLDAKIEWWLDGDDYEYGVRFDEKWMDDDEDWELTLDKIAHDSNRFPHTGTRITVGNLHPPIAEILAKDSAFASSLIKRISKLYSVIISQGFTVTCNGTEIKPKPLTILDSTSSQKTERIEPYFYRDEINGVEVFVAIGLTQSLASENKMENPDVRQRASESAGITVICNDRVVLYNDRTSVTGWGEHGIPSYHTQFIIIRGVVQFSCNEAIKLPLTTTKRGIDESSEVYAKVKVRIREGLKLFTDYTNKWKNDLSKERAYHRLNKTQPRNIDELNSVKLTVGKTKKPALPVPPKNLRASQLTSIQYRRNKDDISKVSMFLFGYENESARKIGEASFDHCLELKENEEV